MEYNAIKKAIEYLVLEGYVILKTISPDREVNYYVVFKWQESYFNTAQSVDFNTVEGIDITEFLIKNSNLYNNKSQFFALFNKAIEDGIVTRCEFSKNSTWYKWSISDVSRKILK